jgi:hypothetical protein
MVDYCIPLIYALMGERQADGWHGMGIAATKKKSS